VRVRGEWKLEEKKRSGGGKTLASPAIPYAVNKAALVERSARSCIERKMPQMLDVRDESTDDVRVVLELKRTPTPGHGHGLPVQAHAAAGRTSAQPDLPGAAGRPAVCPRPRRADLRTSSRRLAGLPAVPHRHLRRFDFELQQLRARIHTCSRASPPSLTRSTR
jgi:hypothetical protein